LPPDARFCHKCGKPQVEYPDPLEDAAAPVETATPTTATAVPAGPPEINFHNGLAVRIGFLAAGLGSLLTYFPTPIPALWVTLSLVLAGFFAAYLYRRRSGQSLSVRAGARIGWITGVFSFAIGALVFTLTIVELSSERGLAAFFREQFKGRVPDDKSFDQFLQALQSPAGMASVVIGSLAMLFVLFTLFPTLGGALGAKVLERE
jgi:hypothetical protein